MNFETIHKKDGFRKYWKSNGIQILGSHPTYPTRNSQNSPYLSKFTEVTLFIDIFEIPLFMKIHGIPLFMKIHGIPLFIKIRGIHPIYGNSRNSRYL